MGVAAEWAALSFDSISGLLKSHLTLQPLPALSSSFLHSYRWLLPYTGKKKKKQLLSQTSPGIPVLRTSCLFPGHTWCFPTQASAHILSSLWNRLLTILPSNRMLIYRLISYVTSSRKPLLLLPIRCYLRFFDHSQYLSCTFLTACSSSAFSCCWAYTFLSPISFFTPRLLFTPRQCWEQCLALTNISLTFN